MSLNLRQAELPIQVFARQASERLDQVYLRQPVQGDYRELSWAESYDQTLRFASALLDLGLQPGDRVALLSENCAEWFLSDFAISAAGLVSVPIYYTAGEDIIRHILEHSGAKAVIVGKLADFSAAQAVIDDSMISIALPYDTMPCKYQFVHMVNNHSPLQDVFMPDVDEVFSINYTSGSTGLPKGAVLTYRNIMYGGISTSNLLEGRDDQQRVLSYLPLAHITERALIEYSSLYTGAIVTFNDSLDTFLDDLRSAEVTFFISVPRLWLKFQAGVLAKIPQKKLDLLLKIPLLNKLVKLKIKKQLGLSQMHNCGSGSAPISPAILEWYRKIGINISEGWGMTEVSGMATTQFPFRADKLGTIGHAMEGLEIKISDDGELLVRGDAVFREYYKDPEKTRETFTEDGFLRTGDKAEVDDDGYFRITGRVKDLFKSGKGKYVAPVPIESKLGANQLIDQVCVMGSGLPKPIAVVVLSEEVAGGMSRDAISASLTDTLKAVNKTLEKHEVMGGLYIASTPWNIENQLLTPTLKIKRAELEEKYLPLISGESDQLVVWE